MIYDILEPFFLFCFFNDEKECSLKMEKDSLDNVRNQILVLRWQWQVCACRVEMARGFHLTISTNLKRAPLFVYINTNDKMHLFSIQVCASHIHDGKCDPNNNKKTLKCNDVSQNLR